VEEGLPLSALQNPVTRQQLNTFNRYVYIHFVLRHIINNTETDTRNTAKESDTFQHTSQLINYLTIVKKILHVLKFLQLTLAIRQQEDHLTSASVSLLHGDF